MAGYHSAAVFRRNARSCAEHRYHRAVEDSAAGRLPPVLKQQPDLLTGPLISQHGLFCRAFGQPDVDIFFYHCRHGFNKGF